MDGRTTFSHLLKLFRVLRGLSLKAEHAETELCSPLPWLVGQSPGAQVPSGGMCGTRVFPTPVAVAAVFVFLGREGQSAASPTITDAVPFPAWEGPGTHHTSVRDMA